MPLLPNTPSRIDNLAQKLHIGVSETKYIIIAAVTIKPLTQEAEKKKILRHNTEKILLDELSSIKHLANRFMDGTILRCVRKVSESDYQLRTDLSVRPSVWNNSDVTGRIIS